MGDPNKRADGDPTGNPDHHSGKSRAAAAMDPTREAVPTLTGLQTPKPEPELEERRPSRLAKPAGKVSPRWFSRTLTSSPEISAERRHHHPGEEGPAASIVRSVTTHGPGGGGGHGHT
ncbi:unnamed protein product [Lampetra planeri]